MTEAEKKIRKLISGIEKAEEHFKSISIIDENWRYDDEIIVEGEGENARLEFYLGLWCSKETMNAIEKPLRDFVGVDTEADDTTINIYQTYHRNGTITTEIAVSDSHGSIYVDYPMSDVEQEFFRGKMQEYVCQTGETVSNLFAAA